LFIRFFLRKPQPYLSKVFVNVNIEGRFQRSGTLVRAPDIVQGNNKWNASPLAGVFYGRVYHSQIVRFQQGYGVVYRCTNTVHRRGGNRPANTLSNNEEDVVQKGAKDQTRSHTQQGN
jgi:hypothetical protein